MRSLLGMLTLLSLLVLPIVCYAEIPSDWSWGWTERSTLDGAYTIDPRSSGIDTPHYTIWSTTSEPQPAGWGGNWYSIDGLGLRFNLEAETNRVTSLDWVLLAGYNGVEPGSYYTNLRNNPDGNSSTNDAYRADPTIRLNLDADDVWDWALVVNAPAGITDGQRAGTWGGENLASLYDLSEEQDPWWRNGLQWDNVSYDPYHLVNSPRPTELWTIPTTADAIGNVDHRLAYTGHPVLGELWEQPSRWFWQGSIDASGLGWTYGPEGNVFDAHASYSMWCGNRLITTDELIADGVNPGIPEPSSFALLFLALGTGLRGVKRLRRKS